MATVNLGIEPEDQIDFTYPFPVTINVTNIGGPSAGLAMTLGVIDALDKGSLTGDRTVAATGTIDAQGDVGAVGGVPRRRSPSRMRAPRSFSYRSRSTTGP